MNNKISIIVPVYKVEKYLKKCVNSIISQSYSNIEIILVDDGSPDNCGKICDEYKEKDNRIIVIHKVNGGLSSARNTGLDIATGDFIGFVDSDDWIEPNMYKELLEFIVNENCDLVECGVNLAFDDKDIVLFPNCSSEVIDGRVALKNQLEIGNKTRHFLPRIAVWSKLYKKDFWKNNRFPEGQIHEDYLLTCKVLHQSSRVGLVKKGLYNHLTDNPNSIVNSRFSSRDLYKVKQYEYRINYLSEKDEVELCKLAKIQYYCLLLETFLKCSENKMIEEAELLQLLRINKDNIKRSNIKGKRKIEFSLFFCSTRLYVLLRKMYKGLKK